MASAYYTEAGARIQSELNLWAQRVEPSDFQDAAFASAFEIFDEALIATIKYMQSRKNGAERHADTENELTELWAKASRALFPFNPELSDACMTKGLGWTDPRFWKNASAAGVKISVDDMKTARSELVAKRHRANAANDLPKWFPIAGVVFAAITVFFLMFLMLGTALEPQKKNVFDVMMAFCAACSSAFLGGSAAAHGRIPLFKNSPVQFSAYGGIGVFVVVFLILHST